MRKLVIFCISLCLMLAGCSFCSLRSDVVFAMDTVMELTIYSDSDTVFDEVKDRISQLDNKLSVTIEGSEIQTLNSEGISNLSEDTRYLLSEALSICESTSGALDISIYPIMTAWGFTTEEYRVPSSSEIEELLQNVDHTKVVIDDNVAVVPQGIKIDLGSVAKGYTGDVICELLRENGITSALLNLGGNVQALGSKPDGSNWNIAIKHPTDEAYLGVLEISDMAAVTSGGYERYFEGDNGEIYWHIIDPQTGYPADSGLISVTVVGKSGLVCDALSTALFVMGIDEAVDYWKNGDQEFEAVFVTEDGSMYITEGLVDSFKQSDEYVKLGLTVIER